MKSQNPKCRNSGQPVSGLAEFFNMLTVVALAILIGVCIGAGI
jgi:hypothetical protein